MNKIELLNQLLSYTIWKQIKGYDNYEVSICGSVRNVKTKRVLKPGIDTSGYYYVNLCKYGKIKVHRIHKLVANAFLPKIDVTKNCVDHIDNNKLNNTISNLRRVTSRQNNFNRSLSSKNTSTIKGVCWNININKWIAYITINGKQIHLGYFENIEDAKQARQLKSVELFGEFLNDCEK